MAKVKSVKFFDLTGKLGNWMSLNVYFYDIDESLIPMDFSIPISYNENYCETDLYIVTSSGCVHYGDNYYSRHAFHTGNVNKNCGLHNIGNCWIAPGEGHWIKIEFKSPQYLSDIKILHTYESDYGFTSCNYTIEYEDNTLETNTYTSNGKLNIFSNSVVRQLLFNQDEYDAQFDSIEFNGKIIAVYDTKVGYVETLDNNNFKNIPVDKFEKIKVLYTNPTDTFITGLISFDNKTTWKAFDGLSWTTISDTTPNNVLLNGMSMDKINNLDKNKLIAGGFTGNMDFLITMKTNDVNKTPSITKIYIEYKNN